MKKNSDSDYKAEDEGSATDNKAKVRTKQHRKPSIKGNKPLQALRAFLPEGVNLGKEPLTLDNYKQLRQMNDAPQFSLNYLVFFGKVSRVVDGDTFKAILFLGGRFNRYTFRLNDIDAPETRKGNVKDFGKKVKEIVTGMIDQKMIKIETGEFDKYGRILCRAYTYSNGEQICLNDFMLEHSLAKEYEGKAKAEFTRDDYDQFLDRIGNQWPKTEDYPFQK